MWRVGVDDVDVHGVTGVQVRVDVAAFKVDGGWIQACAIANPSIIVQWQRDSLVVGFRINSNWGSNSNYDKLGESFVRKYRGIFLHSPPFIHLARTKLVCWLWKACIK